MNIALSQLKVELSNQDRNRITNHIRNIALINLRVLLKEKQQKRERRKNTIRVLAGSRQLMTISRIKELIAVLIVRIMIFFSLLENSTSDQSATQHQCSCDLCQDGFSDGCHMDSGNCCKLESLVILVVPVCGFKQFTRYILFQILFFIVYNTMKSRLKQLMRDFLVFRRCIITIIVIWCGEY